MLARIGELRQLAKRRLNVGCGTVKISGSVNVDVQGDPDVMADARSLPYPDDSIHWLESHHMLEHFSRSEALKVLKEFARVLKPGCLLFLTVPDMARIFDVALQTEDIPELWQGYMKFIYGEQSDEFNRHKFGYNLPYLKHCLGKTGFSDCQGFEWPHRPSPTIGVLARKNL